MMKNHTLSLGATELQLANFLTESMEDLKQFEPENLRAPADKFLNRIHLESEAF